MKKKIQARFRLIVGLFLLVSQCFFGISYSPMNEGDVRYSHAVGVLVPIPAPSGATLSPPIKSKPRWTWVKEVVSWPIQSVYKVMRHIPPFDSQARRFGWPFPFMRGTYSLQIRGAANSSYWEILWPFDFQLYHFNVFAFLFDLLLCCFLAYKAGQFAEKYLTRRAEREHQELQDANGNPAAPD